MTDKDWFDDYLAASDVTFLDLRTEADIENAQKARELEVPDEARDLISELIQIATDDPNLGNQDCAAYLGKATRPRTIEIGKRLDEIGGFTLMLRAHQEVDEAYPEESRMLEMAWCGVGSWLG